MNSSVFRRDLNVPKVDLLISERYDRNRRRFRSTGILTATRIEIDQSCYMRAGQNLQSVI